MWGQGAGAGAGEGRGAAKQNLDDRVEQEARQDIARQLFTLALVLKLLLGYRPPAAVHLATDKHPEELSVVTAKQRQVKLLSRGNQGNNIISLVIVTGKLGEQKHYYSSSRGNEGNKIISSVIVTGNRGEKNYY